MTNYTQDVVCSSIQGAEELLHKSEEVFHNKNKKIVFIENGFQIHIDGLPYYFQLSCFEDIGWNVFLSSISGEIVDNDETDSYYHILEDIIDFINAKYYIEGSEEDFLSYRFSKIKSMTLDRISHLEDIIEIKEVGTYDLKIKFKHIMEFPLKTGYSSTSKKWYYEFHKDESNERILNNSSIRNYLKQLNSVIRNFNYVG